MLPCSGVEKQDIDKKTGSCMQPSANKAHDRAMWRSSLTILPVEGFNGCHKASFEEVGYAVHASVHLSLMLRGPFR